MRTMKSQLKGSQTGLNKLKKSSLKKNAMFAPVHAAAMSNSVELFKLVLGTRGVEPNIACTVEHLQFGVLDCAVIFSRFKNSEIIEHILKEIENPFFRQAEIYPDMSISHSMHYAVLTNNVKITDLLLSKAKQIPSLNHLICLTASVVEDKLKVFTQVLPQAIDQINHPLGDGSFSLLDFAQLLGRREMSEQLQRAGGLEIDISEGTVQDKMDVNSDYRKPDEKYGSITIIATPIKRKNSQICWNCSASSDIVSLYKCKGCRKARYCDDRCQEEDWLVHEDYCEMKMKMREQKDRL